MSTKSRPTCEASCIRDDCYGVLRSRNLPCSWLSRSISDRFSDSEGIGYLLLAPYSLYLMLPVLVGLSRHVLQNLMRSKEPPTYVTTQC
ncbi:hypothetical protein DAEQUDRAFT_733624, partial [Daedalea quercina L-15889]